jgi:predicted anti-sigma-YlaC factor YlaD
MQCVAYREALSARMDGEALGMPERQLAAHVATCRECAAWADDVALVTRRARLAAAPAVPDLTAGILEALPRELPGAAVAARTRLLETALRLALFAVGVAQAALAWPVLVTGPGSMGAPMHLAHETGAWNLAVAAAFVTVAAAPRLAGGALPFLGSFAALLVSFTVADLGSGQVDADRALAHALLIVGVALVGCLAWRSHRHPTHGSRVTA